METCELALDLLFAVVMSIVMVREMHCLGEHIDVYLGMMHRDQCLAFIRIGPLSSGLEARSPDASTGVNVRGCSYAYRKHAQKTSASIPSSLGPRAQRCLFPFRHILVLCGSIESPRPKTSRIPLTHITFSTRQPSSPRIEHPAPIHILTILSPNQQTLPTHPHPISLSHVLTDSCMCPNSV
jgi:hypothetical protein